MRLSPHIWTYAGVRFRTTTIQFISKLQCENFIDTFLDIDCYRDKTKLEIGIVTFMMILEKFRVNETSLLVGKQWLTALGGAYICQW